MWRLCGISLWRYCAAVGVYFDVYTEAGLAEGPHASQSPEARGRSAAPPSGLTDPPPGRVLAYRKAARAVRTNGTTGLVLLTNPARLVPARRAI